MMSISASTRSRLCIRITAQWRAANSVAMPGSRCRPHTSLAMDAPASSAQATTADFMLSMDTGMPRETTSASTGCKRFNSSSAETGSVAPYGRVDSAPISMMSAPSAIMRRACASARSGATNWPPSENESGVTLRTPMTAGYGLDNKPRNPGRSIETADVAVLAGVAIMRSICAVPAWESRQASRVGAGLTERPLTALVGDFRLKLAGLCDQLFDRLFRRQNTDQLAPCIHFFHVLRQAA